MGADSIQKMMGPLQMAAGATATAMGAPQAGIPLMMGGFQSTANGIGGQSGSPAGMGAMPGSGSSLMEQSLPGGTTPLAPPTPPPPMGGLGNAVGAMAQPTGQALSALGMGQPQPPQQLQPPPPMPPKPPMSPPTQGGMPAPNPAPPSPGGMSPQTGSSAMMDPRLRQMLGLM